MVDESSYYSVKVKTVDDSKGGHVKKQTSFLKFFTNHEWLAVLISVIAVASSFSSIYYQNFYENNSLLVKPLFFEREVTLGNDDVFAKMKLAIVNKGNLTQYFNASYFECKVSLPENPKETFKVDDFESEIVFNEIMPKQRKVIELNMSSYLSIKKVSQKFDWNERIMKDAKPTCRLWVSFLGVDGDDFYVELGEGFTPGYFSALNYAKKKRMKEKGLSAALWVPSHPQASKAIEIVVSEGNSESFYNR